jgi:hypothetical protein
VIMLDFDLFFKGFAKSRYKITKYRHYSQFAAAVATIVARGGSVASKIEAIHNSKDQCVACIELG